MSVNQQGEAEESCKRWWKVNPCAGRVATLEASLFTALLKDCLLAMETQYCLVLLPCRESTKLYFGLYFEGYMCILLETIPNLKEMEVMWFSLIQTRCKEMASLLLFASILMS